MQTTKSDIEKMQYLPTDIKQAWFDMFDGKITQHELCVIVTNWASSVYAR